MSCGQMVVLDNFLSDFDDLYNLVTDRDSAWRFLQNTTDSNNLTDLDQGFQRNLPKLLCKSIVNQVNAKLNLNITKIDLARANCKFPTGTPNTRWFHVDQMDPHYVILVYLTQSTAPTRLTDLYWKPGMNPLRQDVKVTELVYPEPNRVLVFDGLRYHADSNPTDKCRMNVNLNGIPSS